MLSTFRSASFVKAMMLTVAVAFVGLMVFDWGADITGRSRARVGDTLGMVNGQKISIKHFEEVLRNAILQAKAQGNPEPDNAQLVRQEWDRLVSQILFAQQIDAFGLSVSDKEVNFYNRLQPPPAIQQYEMFQTEGEFDRTKYSRFLDDPSTYSNPQTKRFVLQIESIARQNLLSQKLQGLVAGAVRVTGPEVRRAYLDAHEKVRVTYAGVEASSIGDSLVSVSDAEIEAYYESHSDDFHQDAAIRADYVSFSKAATPRDERVTSEEARAIAEDIRAGMDFSRLAENNSDDPGSAKKGGDLGFFGRGRMIKAFEDTAFALDPGQVSEPFRTQYGWHILKVEERKGEGDSLQVRARHILLQVRPGRDTLDSLRYEADEFVDLALQAGFSAAVETRGLEASTTGFLTAGSFFPLLGNRTSGLVKWFLESDPGRVSSAFETDDAILVFCLKDSRAAGPRPLDEVRAQVVSRLKSKAKVEIARQRCSGLEAAARAGKALKSEAEGLGLRYAEPPPFARDDFVPIVGRRNAFVGAAFRLDPGEVSGVVSTDRGAYVLQVLERIPVEESDIEAAEEGTADRLIGQKRNEMFSTWFAHIREQAEIVDNRHHFYRSF